MDASIDPPREKGVFTLRAELLFSHSRRKMAAGLLVLVCAAAVLYSVEAQEPYDELTESYKKGVDLAVAQLSSHNVVQHHFRFLRSLEKSEIETGFGVKAICHHFYLKPTKCPRATSDPSPQKCPFRNDRPLMDCAVSYKIAREQIESDPKPYIHCIQRPRLTEAMRVDRRDQCKKVSYSSGSPTLLALSTG